jgi:tetratricopeptide (TPR) repeat protein
MLIDIPTKKPTLIVEPRHAEVVISEDEGTGLSLILPPLEDIAEMKALAPIAYSHRESSAHAYEAVRKQFISELERMKAKQDLYKESPTFANHLANLASVAGLYRDEEVFLRAAQLKMGIGTFFELRLGENLLSQDKSLEAERIFSSETLAMDIHAILRLAYFSIQRHEIDRALELVSRAVGIDPLDFGARLFEGGIKLVMGRPREALVSLKIAIEERPTSSSAHVNVGLCYWRLGMSERALSSLRTAVAIDPLNVNAVILLSDVAFALNQNESAIPSLRLLVEYEQKTPEIWARLARALYSLGQFDETISALKKQGARASDGEVWNNLGAAYIGRGDRRRALESFHYALEVYGEQRDRGYFVAARNLALLLSARPRAIPLIAKLTHKLLREDQHNLILRDRVLSDILALHINAIAASGRDEEAAEI